MNPAYLIDSDWVIDHLNGDLPAVDRISEYEPAGLGVSIISAAELYEGAIYSRHPDKSEKALAEFLSTVAVLGIDEGVARIFGQERGRLRQSGQMIGDFDLLIAATARYSTVPICSDNRSHFNRIEGLTVISSSE